MELIQKALCLLIAILILNFYVAEAKSRRICASIDFDNPTEIPEPIVWNPIFGVGPLIAHGGVPSENEQILSEALSNLAATKETHYKLGSVQLSHQCTLNWGLYEYEASIIDEQSQSKNCFIQVYKDHKKKEQAPGKSTTAVVFACPHEQQYVKTYTEDK